MAESDAVKWKPLDYYPGDPEMGCIMASILVCALVVAGGLLLLALHYV
jgi:hypothetical protein